MNATRRWRQWRNAAYLLLVVVAVVLVAVHWRTLAAIWRQQALTFIGAVVLMVCGTFVQTRNFLTFLNVSSRFRLWTFSRVWALSALANYVAPLQPGIAVRVAWLSRYDVDVAASLLATWRQLIVSVWVALAGLSVGALLTGDPRGRWPAAVLTLVWLALFAIRKFSLGWLLRLQWPMWLARHKELLHRSVTSISIGGILGVAVQYVLGTMLLYWVYDRFGASIDVGQALILACLIYTSSIVALLPGNFGVMEAIYMLGGQGMGLGAAQVGALAVLLRVSHIAGNGILVFCGLAAGDVSGKPRSDAT